MEPEEKRKKEVVQKNMGTDSVRIVILSAIISILFTVPACAGARKTGDPAMSYSHWEPFLVNYTCYIDEGVGSHGDPVQDGMIAGRPMWYGMEVVIYEAIPQEDGSYKIGRYIETGKILDTGYGISVNDLIPSKVRSDKPSRGSIEVGRCIDRWCGSYKEAKEWMALTQGHVFIQLIDGDG